jgi:hypothetical protein
MVVFSLPYHLLSVPGLPEGSPLPGATRCVDPRGGSLSPSELRRQVSVTQRNPERLRNQLGSPTHQTGKNLSLNSSLPHEVEKESNQLLETETPK